MAGRAGEIELRPVLGLGVYLLRRQGRVVYVGVARDMLARIAAHRDFVGRRASVLLPQFGVRFDSASAIPCKTLAEARDLAAELIAQYNPNLNIESPVARLRAVL